MPVCKCTAYKFLFAQRKDIRENHVCSPRSSRKQLGCPGPQLALTGTSQVGMNHQPSLWAVNHGRINKGHMRFSCLSH